MGQKILSVLETYLKDIICTYDEIITKVEDREHIFEIKDSEVSLGYISLYDLKDFIITFGARNSDSFRIYEGCTRSFENIYPSFRKTNYN